MSTLLKGRIFTFDGIFEGSILIEGGIISKIARGDLNVRADESLDFRGKPDCLILPGFIDAHVHLRDLELSYKEDFYTGTRAAAKGGYTIIADMPNSKPRTNTPSSLEEKARIAEEKAMVDFGLYYGVPKDPAHLTEIVKELAIGIKIYMVEDFYSETREMAMMAFSYAAGENLPVVVHAENPSFFVDSLSGKIRTTEAEASAIGDACAAATNYGFQLHVTHLSSLKGLNEFIRWKEKLGCTSDTCPHYFLLTEEVVESLKGVAKVYPPLRGEADVRAILEAVRTGKIDAITSDHAPHAIWEKAVEFERALGGFPGLETTLPLLLTLVEKNLLKLEDLVKLCSTNPAKIFRIKNVGAIEEGKIGNLTVVDLSRRHKIEPENFESKSKLSPFGGMEVIGKAVATIVRGSPVMLEGEIIGEKGWGTNVKNYG
jgi:dihydroorotase